MNLFTGGESHIFTVLKLYAHSVLNHKKSVSAVLLLTLAFFLSYYLDGPHQKVSELWHTCMHTHTRTYIQVI